MKIYEKQSKSNENYGKQWIAMICVENCMKSNETVMKSNETQ